MSSAVQRSRTESARRDPVKSHGVHYTPPELARFLARHALAHLDAGEQISVLDPACGDGELLAAILDEAESILQDRLTLIGVDRDASSVAATEHRLASAGFLRFQVHQADFLASPRTNRISQLDLFEPMPPSSPVPTSVDLIISNPPYVRTQVLGSEVAQKLASQYNLSGRVDLYHAFVRGMTDRLSDRGVLALLCSNRFLTTQGGAALRELLWNNYELCEVFDLGDTKLFEAAVLPAVIIARKRTQQPQQHCSFVRTYQSRAEYETGTATYPSVLAALEGQAEGLVTAGVGFYEIERGSLKTLGTPSDPWTMTSSRIADWLATVERHTETTIGDIATIRVGIKTTADAVFIRKDWESLPKEQQPEEELLHPLLTHFVADRWRSEQADGRRVLYPHMVRNGRRQVIPLDKYPRARAYLESHREWLTSRSYVTSSGRQWYEIWVPQHPGDWSKPKLVFPDISEMSRFFLDTSGAIVNGDCYWIKIDGALSLDVAFVILAVANSTFAIKFYDAVCSNRLYSGRRRFITQYVKRFPIPRLSVEQRAEVICMVEQLVMADKDSEERMSTEEELDAFIWQAFGLAKEV